MFKIDHQGSLVIRDARGEELDEVARVLYVAYREHVPTPMPQARAQKWGAYWRDIGDVRGRLPVTELLVATLGDRIVATVTLYPDGTLLPRHGWPDGWAGLRLLGVVPEARGRGIGRALTEECVRRAHQCGASVIGLHTDNDMQAARRLYERMGFQRAPEHDYQPFPGLTVMAYRFPLVS